MGIGELIALLIALGALIVAIHAECRATTAIKEAKKQVWRTSQWEIKQTGEHEYEVTNVGPPVIMDGLDFFGVATGSPTNEIFLQRLRHNESIAFHAEPLNRGATVTTMWHRSPPGGGYAPVQYWRVPLLPELQPEVHLDKSQ